MDKIIAVVYTLDIRDRGDNYARAIDNAIEQCAKSIHGCEFHIYGDRPLFNTNVNIDDILGPSIVRKTRADYMQRYDCMQAIQILDGLMNADHNCYDAIICITLQPLKCLVSGIDRVQCGRYSAIIAMKDFNDIYTSSTTFGEQFAPYFVQAVARCSGYTGACDMNVSHDRQCAMASYPYTDGIIGAALRICGRKILDAKRPKDPFCKGCTAKLKKIGFWDGPESKVFIH